MLRHIVGDRFEADNGDQIQIVTRSQNNNGINDARFEYAGATLPRQTIQGQPGCTFTVRDGRKQFQAVVMFDGAATTSARYDLFEVDEVGGFVDLDRHVTKANSSPLVGLAVEGVAAEAAAAVRRAAPPPAAARKHAAKKAARKRRTSGKKTARKAATRSTTTARKTERKTKKGARKGTRKGSKSGAGRGRTRR
jgi:hypothetical protein